MEVLTDADVETIQPEAQAEIEEQLQMEVDETEALNFVLVREVPQSPLLDKSKVAVSETEAAKGIVSIAKLAYHISLVVYRTAKRYVQHRDHGFTATVVEEALREFYMADFGAWVWAGMREVAEHMWSANLGVSGDQLHGGRYFLEGLCKVQQQKPSLIVDLVGHSAGSIAICMMLHIAAANTLPLKVRNLILMAPACTSDLFHQEIVMHPERYERFRMFTMDTTTSRKPIICCPSSTIAPCCTSSPEYSSRRKWTRRLQACCVSIPVRIRSTCPSCLRWASS